MSTRLIPKYVVTAGWNVLVAYADFEASRNPLVLKDAMRELREALLRDPMAAAEAPDDVLQEWLRGRHA